MGVFIMSVDFINYLTYFSSTDIEDINKQSNFSLELILSFDNELLKFPFRIKYKR